MLLLLVATWGRPAAEAAPPRIPTVAPITAAALLDQALHRFDAPPQRRGVLHERFVSGRGPQTLIIERWFDYRPPHRLRLTLRRAARPAPLLDLVVAGPDRLAYLLRGSGTPTGGQVQAAAVAAYLPILAQLPATGAFGMQAVPEADLEVGLLAEARHGPTTLLGQTTWHGRPAYLISSRRAAGGGTILTLDRATLSLLEVRRVDGAGGGGAVWRPWQAEVVKVHAAALVPAGQFALPEQPQLTAINPRQLFRGAVAALDLARASRVEPLPLPARLPEPVLLAYIHRAGMGRSAQIHHVYASRWSTLIVTPAPAARDEPRAELDRRFRRGAYRVVETPLPQTTLVELAFDAAPQRRLRLYLWHALATPAARDALAVAIVEQLGLPDQATIARARFLAPQPPARRVEAQASATAGRR